MRELLRSFLSSVTSQSFIRYFFLALCLVIIEPHYFTRDESKRKTVHPRSRKRTEEMIKADIYCIPVTVQSTSQDHCN